MKLSLEITTKSNLDDIPDIREVFIVFPPGADYRLIVDKCEELIIKGYSPVPHVPARSIPNKNVLRDYVTRVKDLGVGTVLIIGGDRAPVGDYHASIQLIETGYFEGLRIGIAGHPDGAVNMSDDTVKEALASKAPYADFIVTQWTLDIESIKRFIAEAPLPVRVGIAGPASVNTLFKFAQFMGIKNSFRFMANRSSKLIDLLSEHHPDAMINELSSVADSFHIYAFGGVRKVSEWLTLNKYI